MSINHLTVWAVPPNIVEGKRSGEWPTLRKRFIEANPSCIACGRTDSLEVHHICPVHIDPSKELDPDNLCTFCDRCHLVVGHLNSWHKVNRRATLDAATLLSRHTLEFARAGRLPDLPAL